MVKKRTNGSEMIRRAGTELIALLGSFPSFSLTRIFTPTIEKKKPA
jgi:hypothetical protein